jgi:general secretion pathway protein D
MRFEEAEEWDRAAEEFALAVTENPKNPEYKLHYIRALFNASQMFMKRGRVAAEEEDYVGAYNAFRKAYGFDPVNELAKTEMARMLRKQKELLGITDDPNKDDSASAVRMINTGLGSTDIPSDVVIPQRYEKLRDLPFPSGIDLQRIVRDLAKDLDINVLFDSQSRLDNKKVKIELKNVTSAQALDAIFLQEGLFFEKVAPRTIIVATSNRRQFFQQLVLKTFYLGNADPKKVAAILQKAIPAQPGRTPTNVLTDEDTNSITIRDTVENIRLMSDLILALDKDRAEVVMDVQIYEVSKNDLLQLGNQIGDRGSLTNLGGVLPGIVPLNGAPLSVFGENIPSTAIGIALNTPFTNLAAFQKKSNTRLLASTQIHAFNNEDSSARIGQRVPVQTASVFPFSSGSPGTPTEPGSPFGGGYPVINYEQVGLTLKFKPIVFPNQDVQVAMEIESKDVQDSSTLTPIFTERTIKGTARVQNNKTLLLASVAQGVESRGREGLPFLGLIPILGRLFTAPTRDNRQVDIVIAITPRVIRAPAILPEDTIERPTGSLAVPTSGSLEALVIREEIERQKTLARREKRDVKVQLPDADVPQYVKTDGDETLSVREPAKTVEDEAGSAVKPASGSVATNLKPIDTGMKTLAIKPASSSNSPSPGNTLKLKPTSLPSAEREDAVPSTETVKTAELQFLPKPGMMRAGERTKFAILVRGASAFRSAVLGLKFDPAKLAVRSVQFGDVYGKELSQSPADPFLNEGGKLYVSMIAPNGSAENSSGVLAFIEIEALADGIPAFEFDPEMISLLTAAGDGFEVSF